MNFAELTQIALLGTERQALPTPKGIRVLEQLQAQVDLHRREESLLSAAALAGLHERIGRLPAQDVGPIPEACAAEGLPRVPERAGSLLLRLLSGEHAVLLPEFFALGSGAGRPALPEALPVLLAMGAERAELREGILPLLGVRGRWLAAQNAEWAWVSGASGDDENIWQVGEPPARLMFLQRLRRTNPARARDLLISTWKEEPPDDRARFLAALQIGISPEDEAFLETALDDKRKEVRRAAAALLGGLPESALVKRMIERAKPRLKFIPAETGKSLKLKRAKSAAIEVTLPAECDKAMERDGIEARPPPAFGEKAWWLTQMLECVPLDFWTKEWQVSPGDILAASLQGEWKEELIECWMRATARQGRGEWADLLWISARDAKQFDKIRWLLRAMSPAQREARLSELLGAKDSDTQNQVGTLVAEGKTAWSPPFSRTVLAWLKRLTAEPPPNWQLRHQMKDFAPCLHPSLLAEAATGWAADSPGWNFWSKDVDEFLAVAQFRADMHAAFAQPTNS